jgi:hypothetical protein
MSDHQVVRLYYATYKLLTLSHQALTTLHSVLRACFAGLWLGLLRPETLLDIDRVYYANAAKYTDSGYNRSGLWAWEREMITRFFGRCQRLLIVGAGGGREVLALTQLGFEAQGLECNHKLVLAANLLLAEEKLPPTVQYAPPNTCPDTGTSYDGLVVGWGAYMLIQGRAQRIALLRSMRNQTPPDAPVLISFFSRPTSAKRFLIITVVGNVLRRLLGRERLELGDDLEPEYVHYFTQEEIATELQEGGFKLVFYNSQPYGHAVGIAV